MNGAEEAQALALKVKGSIGNWEKTVQYIQSSAPGTVTDPNSPFNLHAKLPNIQGWLDKAKAAVETGDKWALRSAANTARDAWRPVASALQSTATRVVPAAEAAIPAIESMAPAAESIVQPLVPIAEEVVATVENNPVVVPLAVAAGRAALVGGARGIFGGWVGVAIGATVAVAIAVGAYAWSNRNSGGGATSEAVSAQAPTPAPVPAPEPPPPPPQNLLGGGEQPPPPNPVPEPSPVQAPQRSQTPTPPPPAPTPQCAYPDSIGVSGGSTSSLGPQGGTFTVTSPNVVLSTGGLVNCGKHYQLGYSVSDGASGHDCKTSGFNYDISGNVSPGKTVSVVFSLPPNSCN